MSRERARRNKPMHHPDCDVNDPNIEGIQKPCNCPPGWGATPLPEVRGAPKLVGSGAVVRARRWHVYRVNCDCAGYLHAFGRLPQSGEFLHCIYCHRRLGDMELHYFGAHTCVRPSDAITLLTKRPNTEMSHGSAANTNKSQNAKHAYD